MRLRLLRSLAALAIVFAWLSPVWSAKMLVRAEFWAMFPVNRISDPRTVND
jgi:hypothetical protein